MNKTVGRIGAKLSASLKSVARGKVVLSIKLTVNNDTLHSKEFFYRIVDSSAGGKLRKAMTSMDNRIKKQKGAAHVGDNCKAGYRADGRAVKGL